MATLAFNELIIPYYFFLLNGQTKDFVHGDESFKTQATVEIFVYLLSTQYTVCRFQVNHRE